MAVNVSQKDMTLREVIRRLREERAYVMDLVILAGMTERTTLTRYNGQLDAYDAAIRRLLPHLNAERTANLIYDSEYGVKTEVLD